MRKGSQNYLLTVFAVVGCSVALRLQRIVDTTPRLTTRQARSLIEALFQVFMYERKALFGNNRIATNGFALFSSTTNDIGNAGAALNPNPTLAKLAD